MLSVDLVPGEFAAGGVRDVGVGVVGVARTAREGVRLAEHGRRRGRTTGTGTGIRARLRRLCTLHPRTRTRIASSVSEPHNAGALQVTAAAGPGENDQVIEAAGARVFLERQAAAYLEDKVLDAQIDEQGEAHFSLGVQSPGQA